MNESIPRQKNPDFNYLIHVHRMAQGGRIKSGNAHGYQKRYDFEKHHIYSEGDTSKSIGSDLFISFVQRIYQVSSEIVS